MEKYKKIFAWNVINEIKNGRNVKCIDRKEGIVHIANVIRAECLLKIIDEYDKHDYEGRYEFYYVETEGETNDNI